MIHVTLYPRPVVRASFRNKLTACWWMCVCSSMSEESESTWGWDADSFKAEVWTSRTSNLETSCGLGSQIGNSGK